MKPQGMSDRAWSNLAKVVARANVVFRKEINEKYSNKSA